MKLFLTALATIGLLTGATIASASGHEAPGKSADSASGITGEPGNQGKGPDPDGPGKGKGPGDDNGNAGGEKGPDTTPT